MCSLSSLHQVCSLSLSQRSLHYLCFCRSLKERLHIEVQSKSLAFVCHEQVKFKSLWQQSPLAWVRPTTCTLSRSLMLKRPLEPATETFASLRIFATSEWILSLKKYQRWSLLTCVQAFYMDFMSALPDPCFSKGSHVNKDSSYCSCWQKTFGHSLTKAELLHGCRHQ